MKTASRLIELCESLQDEADSSLAAYTKDPENDYKMEPHLEELLSRYGNDKPIVLYRGLNFATRRDYEKFLARISSGVHSSKSMESWSPSKSEAATFARTRPTYMEFMTPETRKLLSDQKYSRERIAGYRGLILRTKIKTREGIDVGRSAYSKEQEVILPSGDWKVTFTEEKSFKDKLDDEPRGVSEIILGIPQRNMRSKREVKKWFEYLLNSGPSDLTDEAKHHVFKLLGYAAPIKIRIDYDDTLHVKDKPVLRVDLPEISNLASLGDYLLPSDIESYRKRLSRRIPAVLRSMKLYWDKRNALLLYRFPRASLREVVEFTGQQSIFLRYQRSTTGKAYHALQKSERGGGVPSAQHVLDLLSGLS